MPLEPVAMTRDVGLREPELEDPSPPVSAETGAGSRLSTLEMFPHRQALCGGSWS